MQGRRLAGLGPLSGRRLARVRQRRYGLALAP